MRNKFIQHINKLSPTARIAISVAVIAIVFLGYSSYEYRKLAMKLSGTLLENASSTTVFGDNIKKLNNELAVANQINNDLQLKLGGEVARNDFFNQQIQSISSTVGVLDKLSKTDKELLQKYSNVYFLNENYIPSALSGIDLAYLNRPTKIEQIHTSVKPYLEALLQTASSTGIKIQVLSGYRSFGTQASLKASYKVVYGSGANKFSADQGYSEHQLGSTIDFTTPKGGEILEGFDKTTAYTWLLENAYRYGFIISYPKTNSFFEYEPWHWRFVGVELATKLHSENKYFYDLDQREIDTYLVKIFD